MITGLAAPFPVLPYLLHTIIGTLGVVLAFVVGMAVLYVGAAFARLPRTAAGRPPAG